ncbi:AfsR/SARP family transcriptional regulator [Streptomyces albipurpureus]|uniref:Winged helix-turn-helix domain-containing protein n=1 Tax=Streptomyces albipurpureus TaxID=2897419 RepID=A0ABT0USG3_9ACTN|nr:BTAD domain-containing putative transcriptional regulator [Streptomyces sp. CWNU-1]MCM2391010.1 winged helix-turn-helix domain-containing protein [Streptomyces sp. CWNU-1]
MHYRLLGTTQAIDDDGRPVPMGGARLRALLTVLALRVGRTVPVGVLIAEVWDDDPPADASAAVQALVGRLRRAIGRKAVTSVAGGYRLSATADDIDLHRFARLAGEGARALERGDPGRATELLDEALELWRGPVLADLPQRGAEVSRWESRRLDARRNRLSAALLQGRAKDTLVELNTLCADHPIDESLQALRLRALQAVGRPAEALADYETFRRRLADRLGADPGPALRALHAELLGVRERSAPTSPHPAIASAPAASHEPASPGDREPAVDHRAAPPGAEWLADPPPAAQAPVRQRPAVGNLRARLTSFVGRERDIEAIRDDLAKARLVTLLGPGGAGKTRLSQEAAEGIHADAPDGVWLAELAPVDDPDDVPETVLAALGARETVLRGAGAEELRVGDAIGGDPLVRLIEHCSRRRMLLVLDNCEHVVTAAATLAEQLLESCPGLTILATSREPLGIPGELVRPVGPLPDPMALRLLADRGAAARPDFRVEDDPEACAEICRRLDGLPLAIELAAARLRMLTPRQIADRLDDRFRLLTSGSRTVLPRQQTLRAVVDWSWDLLDAAERAVLRRLSVFAGGCELTAAEAVCADGPDGADGTDGAAVPEQPHGQQGPNGSDETGAAGARLGPGSSSTGSGPGRTHGAGIADVLGSLIDKSLVVATPTPHGDMRYRLLETVAEYAEVRLDEAAERAATERRHLVHYRELARTTDPLLRGPGQGAAIETFQTEYENLRTALRRAIGDRDEQEALCLVISLSWYWQIRDLRGDARHWSTLAGELGPDPFAPPYVPAPPVYERVTDSPPPMAPLLLDEARRGVAMLRMIFVDHGVEEWGTPENQARLRGVTEVYRPGLPQTCRAPGALWFFAILMTGDMEQLKAMLDATVQTCRDLGYEWELATALQMRASVLAHRVHWSGDAARDAEEAWKLFTGLGDDWGASEALSARGETRERNGEYELAAEDYNAAIVHAERIGARIQVAVLRGRLAGILLEMGQGEQGEAMARGVLSDYDGATNESTAIARIHLALWLGQTGRRDEARAEIELLMEQFRRNTMAIFEGMLIGMLAWLDLGDGEYESARTKALDALERARDRLSVMVAPQLLSVQLVTLASALVGGWPDRAESAALLLGVAGASIPPGYTSTRNEREIRTSAEAEVRAVLGHQAYESAYARGGGLSLDEAAALAR